MSERFELAELVLDAAAHARPYLEFVRTEAMSVGLYVLAAGGVDGQQPHREDEVYVVMTGRAHFTGGDETRDVGPGDVLYVAAGVPHRFHDITEDLQVIVVFAPPETTGDATALP